MVTAANLGFPRMGLQRELKKALEAYWKGNISEDELQTVAKEMRVRHWNIQKDAGVDVIATNDFSLYDHILDASCTVGNIPARYNWDGGEINLDLFFAMARGRQQDGQDVVAMEMTKWFDTNYHYIVPEFEKNTEFKLSSLRAVDQFKEAQAIDGVKAQPTHVGPVTYLLIGKLRGGSEDERLDLLPKLLPVYAELINKLAEAGATSIQLDEAALITNLNDKERAAFKTAYAYLAENTNIDITLATYFGDLRDNMDTTLNLPVKTIHVDLVRGANQLDDVLANLPADKNLSLGLIDGRNIWKADLAQTLATAEKAVAKLGTDRIIIAPSCSLLHTPIDLDDETAMDAEIKNWLAFAKQKLVEVAKLADAINGKKDEAFFAANAEANAARKTSPRIHNEAVKSRVAGITDAMYTRTNVFAERIKAQQANLNLPLLPTTTIGSFPQTAELRKQRALFKKGGIDRETYDKYIEELTKEVIQYQDEIGMDMPVHGEYERNDMVEYFGEKMSGYVFSKNGWVQSYGSRCVKPPIIFGDVSRPEAMTVRWSAYAQSLTNNPVKGMLSGPITMLQWSFVRNDQPRETTCKQLALALRDEVTDLEAAGIRAIQIDEPAIREGLPLRKEDTNAYLKWAVGSFQLSAAGVEDKTQIHTHMCYSEFNDIIDSIAALDADVISIETSRSAMELLDAFVEFNYPNEIGPGVYDIHSPRIPNQEEMEHLLNKALDVLKPEQVWVNPDCGLKTRGWAEVRPALEHMVAAAKSLRASIAEQRKQA